jgi:hypothetical protein
VSYDIKPAFLTYATSADPVISAWITTNYLNEGLLTKTNEKMKPLFVLASLLAVAQAQFSIGAPTSGATLQAGQNVTVQIIVPIDTVSYTLRSTVELFFSYQPI